MRVFLDSSTVLSACGGERSLSSLVLHVAPAQGWEIVSAAYCRTEVARNVAKLGQGAERKWEVLEQRILWLPNALTSKRPLLLAASKDKPVVISALAGKCDALLTLDSRDFEVLLGTHVYGMLVTTPREFLIAAGFTVRSRRDEA